MAKKSRAKTSRRTARSAEPAARARSRRAPQRIAPVFARRNYVLLGVGVGMLALGYVLMALDGSLDGFVALTLAPILIAAGYGGVVWSALYRARPEEAEAA